MKNPMVLGLILACAVLPAGAAPETLRFDGPAGDFFLKVDYDRAPDRVPPIGARWSDFERDSSWTDTVNGSPTYHLRYVRAFYVSQSGETGVGFDRIRRDGDAIEASLSFLFLAGNKETVYAAAGRHFRPRTDLDPIRNQGLEIGGALLAQTYESFLPTGSGEVTLRARLEGFDARLGPGPFRGRDVCRK